MRKPISLITSVVALALVAVLAFGAGSSTASIQAAEQASSASQPVSATTPVFVTESERILYDLYSRIAPSVVSINVVARVSSGTQNQTVPSDGLVEGTGTGFVWDAHGHIVTNFHVIRGANAARVTLADQSSYSAKLVGAFPDGNSALILVSARLRHVVGTLWGRKRYMDMSRLNGLTPAAPPVDKIVAGQFA